MVAGRVPALDGVRGFAVVGVILFHAGYLDGGFLGVDLFFVLSGFLITGLLLDDQRLGHFYARRARRLAPALLAMVLVVGGLAPVLLDAGVLADVRDSGVATLLYYANWHAVGAEQDYFAALAGANPFEHTWSLAIEEQVYLVWPLLVLVALRVGGRWLAARSVVLGLSVALAVVSSGAWAVVADDPARAYYGTDTRAFAVLAGAALAAGLRWPGVRAWFTSSRAAAGLGLVAGAGLATSWLIVDGSTSVLYRGGLPLLGVSGAMVVGVVATRAPRILAVPPLVGLGLISYGLYLWHWPVFVVLDADRVGFGGVGLGAVRIAVSLAIAVVSYVAIERPVRVGRAVPTERWRLVLPAALATSAVGLLLGTAGAVDRSHGDIGTSAYTGVEAAPDGRPRLLVLGDSQAFELGLRGSGLSYDHFQIANVAFLACGIGPGLAEADGVVVTYSLLGEACDSVLPTWERALADFDPDVVLVHVGAWEVLDRRIDDRTVAFGTAEWTR